jgi:hypothetical protein
MSFTPFIAASALLRHASIPQLYTLPPKSSRLQSLPAFRLAKSSREIRVPVLTSPKLQYLPDDFLTSSALNSTQGHAMTAIMLKYQSSFMEWGLNRPKVSLQTIGDLLY